jgi:hypothetical protein
VSLKNKLKTGGFLNNVDVVVTDVNWVVGDTAKIKQGKNKGKDFTPLLLLPEFTVDGASEPTPQRLLVGNAENMTFEIFDDGKTIEFSEGGLYANSEAGIFLNSCETPEDGELQITEFGDDDNASLIDVTALVNARMRLVRPVNEDRPQQKGKDGKMYDARDLKCAEIYELGGAAEEKPEKGAKPSGKTDPKKGGKKAEPEADGDDDDVSPEDTAKIVLLRYLEAAPDRTLPITKLKTKVSTDKAFAKDLKLAKVIIGLLEDPAFLKGVDEVEFNSKKGTVTLPEEE